MHLLCLYGLKLHFFFACGGHLGFSQLTVSKKMETVFSVLIETLGSEKLQFYKIYMKGSALHELLRMDMYYEASTNTGH